MQKKMRIGHIRSESDSEPELLCLCHNELVQPHQMVMGVAENGEFISLRPANIITVRMRNVVCEQGYIDWGCNTTLQILGVDRGCFEPPPQIIGTYRGNL